MMGIHLITLKIPNFSGEIESGTSPGGLPQKHSVDGKPLDGVLPTQDD
jgi:hypothetical protein